MVVVPQESDEHAAHQQAKAVNPRPELVTEADSPHHPKQGSHLDLAGES